MQVTNAKVFGALLSSLSLVRPLAQGTSTQRSRQAPRASTTAASRPKLMLIALSMAFQSLAQQRLANLHSRPSALNSNNHNLMGPLIKKASIWPTAWQSSQGSPLVPPVGLWLASSRLTLTTPRPKTRVVRRQCILCHFGMVLLAHRLLFSRLHIHPLCLHHILIHPTAPCNSTQSMVRAITTSPTHSRPISRIHPRYRCRRHRSLARSSATVSSPATISVRRVVL